MVSRVLVGIAKRSDRYYAKARNGLMIELRE